MKNLLSAGRSLRLRYMVLAGIIIACFLLFVWGGNLFTPTRLHISDFYHVPIPTQDTITIITIDDASLARYGRIPSEWSRDAYVELIEELTDANPRVLSFDILFSETEENDDLIAQAFANLQQNEARTRVVLAAAGTDMILSQDVGEDPSYISFANTLPISPQIVEQGSYQGYINGIPDTDGVVRRHTSLVKVEEEIRYSFSIASYLAYLRIPASVAHQVIRIEDQTLFITEQRRIPIDSFSLWQPYYFGPPSSYSKQTFPTVSFVDVVDGLADPNLFTDKIVLVGVMNTTGVLDRYQVPSSSNGALMAGVEIQANAIESLLQNIFLSSLPDAWQAGLIIVWTILASIAYAIPRWHIKIVIALVLLFAWLILASILFSTTHIMINLFDTSLAIMLPLLVSIGVDISLETRERKQKEFLLNSLQRIAQQRLQLVQAVDYVLKDIHQLAPNITCSLYLRDSTVSHVFAKYQNDQPPIKGLSEDDDPILQRYGQAQEAQQGEYMTIIPMVWHSKQQGMFVLEHPQQKKLDKGLEHFLADLAGQLAPNLENMLLYDELQRQKLLLDAIFTESPAGIATINQDGQVIQSNMGLISLFGLDTIADIQGQSLQNLLAENTEDQGIPVQLSEGIKTGKSFSITDVSIREQTIYIDIAPLRSYSLWTVVIGDITAVTELSKLKTQMLRIASHDLKNPLSRIMGFAELIAMSGVLDERGERFLGFIKSSSEEMLRIINDILSLERLRSGSLSLEWVNLSQMVEEVCSSHQPDLIQKKQDLTLQIADPEISSHLDAGQISQAVSNFVGNAIKYTPDEGKITVRLYTEEEQIHFQVEDTGYGIPEEAQGKLFSEFYRAASEATAHIPGTGLGLSLVKTVIEAHQGTIGFESTQGVGSTFYFTLPASNQNDTNKE